jgi:ribosomal protein S18 acetylase RimI-like enzyme
MLARAFQEDPVSRYMFPDPRRRARLQAWSYERWARCVAPLGGAYITSGGEGAAFWTPPHLAPGIPLWRQVRAGLLWTPFVFGLGYMPNVWRAYSDSQRRHHAEVKAPHSVLDVIGVDPACQGRGVGAALLEHIFEQADRAGVPCYVITHNEKNIGFYGHHGFRVIASEHALPGGPPTISFRRDAGT